MEAPGVEPLEPLNRDDDLHVHAGGSISPVPLRFRESPPPLQRGCSEASSAQASLNDRAEGLRGGPNDACGDGRSGQQARNGGLICEPDG